MYTEPQIKLGTTEWEKGPGYSPTTRAPDDVDNIRILLRESNKMAQQWSLMESDYITREIWVFSV